MKKILLTIIALAVAGSSLFAQQKQKKTAEERTEKIYAKMDEVVELREDQKLKVKDIILVREQARDKDKKELSANKEELKKVSHLKNVERDENLKANLSPEQYAKLVAYRDEQKKQRHMKKEAKPATEEISDDL